MHGEKSNLNQDKSNHRQEVTASVSEIECVVCEETFESERDLKEHRKLEKLGFKSCTECGMKIRSSISRHMERMHGRRQFECVSCEIRIKSFKKLKEHELTEHKIVEATIDTYL